MIIDPRIGERQGQDGHIYTKIKYMAARQLKLFELMYSMHFLQSAHNVIMDEYKGNQYAAMDTFHHIQKCKEFDRRQRGYQKLHKEMDVYNAITVKQGYSELLRMPLEWHSDNTICHIDRLLVAPSSSKAKPAPQLKKKA